MKTEWRYPFDDSGLNYLSSKAKQINDIATLFGVPAPGLAGGIAREMTLERREYPKDLLRLFGQPLKAWLTSTEVDQPGRDPMTADSPLLPWKPITHGTIADYFARSNTLPRNTLANPTYPDRLANPIFFDVGPSNVKIRTAITMLQNYNRMFPDYDPLHLKRYNDQYDVLVRDLKNPDSDTSIKIAGLVAREGRDFYIKAMTPQRWAALSEDQKAAALTKYYALGKERMEDDFLKQGGVPRTYTPDFDGDGSDMYLYEPGNGTGTNPARLKDALSPPVHKQDDAPNAAGTADGFRAGCERRGRGRGSRAATRRRFSRPGSDRLLHVAAAGGRQRQLSARQRLRDHAAHHACGACARAGARGRSVPPHRFDRFAPRGSLARRGDGRAGARLGAGVARGSGRLAGRRHRRDRAGEPRACQRCPR
jgi:hypothetical protein